MLVDMKIGVEAGRSLLYETARLVDIQNSLEKRSEIYPDQAKAIRNEAKQYVQPQAKTPEQWQLRVVAISKTSGNLLAG